MQQASAYVKGGTVHAQCALRVHAHERQNDEVFQWVAAKWGLSPDVVRAVAYVESRWRMSMAGDGGVSFGLMQVKSTVHQGTAPLSSCMIRQ